MESLSLLPLVTVFRIRNVTWQTKPTGVPDKHPPVFLASELTPEKLPVWTGWFVKESSGFFMDSINPNIFRNWFKHFLKPLWKGLHLLSFHSTHIFSIKIKGFHSVLFVALHIKSRWHVPFEQKDFLLKALLAKVTFLEKKVKNYWCINCKAESKKYRRADNPLKGM